MKLALGTQLMEADASGLAPAVLVAEVTSFVLDSREAKAGTVFFALSQPEYQNNCFNGDFDDSTAFVAAALENGAVAAVVRPDRFEEHRQTLEKYRDRLILADDCIVALQKLAHGVYKHWNRPVVGITGSAGKTTARELTAHILASGGKKVLRSIKNYNNGLGLPLTVLNLAKDDSYDLAVLEMGMSTPNNEIARLCNITPPDVAVVLTVLEVHIEHLGSIERIQQAKREIVEGMKAGGTAVLNADDFRVLGMRERSKGKTITFGIDHEADVMAKNVRYERFGETKFSLVTPDATAEVDFPLNGRHNISNALAAAAVAVSFGMTAREIAKSLSSVVPPPNRGEILHFAEGFTVVNDTYNSNAEALVSMVTTIVEGGAGAKRKIVIAGEMRELGEQAAGIHYETGKRIAALGIDRLYGVDNLAGELLRGARENGLDDVRFFENSVFAAEEFVKLVRPGDLILVKGSRGVKTERVVEKLLEKFELSKS